MCMLDYKRVPMMVRGYARLPSTSHFHSISYAEQVHNPNHTHSLANFQYSRLSDQRMNTVNCLEYQKWSSQQDEFYMQQKKYKKPTNAKQGFSTASHNSRHVLSPGEGRPPTTHFFPFLPAQNLSSRWIAPT